MLRARGIFLLALCLGAKPGFCARFDLFPAVSPRALLGTFWRPPLSLLAVTRGFCSTSDTGTRIGTGRRIPTRVVPSPVSGGFESSGFGSFPMLDYTATMASSARLCPPKRIPFDRWALEPIPPPPPAPALNAAGKRSLVIKLSELPPPPETKEKKTKPKKVANPASTPPALVAKLDEIEAIKSRSSNVSFLSITDFCRLFGRYVVLDCEFTGLAKDDRVTEVGCVELKNFQATGRKFSSLVNPLKAVRPSAHKLTGYTQRFLENYPTFETLVEGFLEFLGDSPLVIHHADGDLYFLNKELTFLGFKLLQERHEIVDTLRIAQNLYKGEKNNLESLALRNGVDMAGRIKHGALTDAEILSETFVSLARRHGLKVLSQKEHRAQSFDNALVAIDSNETVKKILGEAKAAGDPSFEAFFKDREISLPLPRGLRYAKSSYHLGTGKLHEALICDFSKTEAVSDRLLVHYCLPEEDLKKLKEASHPEHAKPRYFFGDPRDVTVTLHRGGDEVLFIGELFGSLAVRELLFGEKRKELSRAPAFKENEVSIKVLPDFCLLPHTRFPKRAKAIYLVLDNYDKDDMDAKSVLERVIERVCVKQYFCLDAMLEADLTRRVLKYNQQDWVISEDINDGETRSFTLTKPGSKEKANLTLDLTERTAVFNEEIIRDPDKCVLISSTPEITLRLIALNYGPNEEFSPARSFRDPRKFADRLPQALQLKTVRDIPFIHKRELARSIYESAMTIDENSVARAYFRQRGINCELPETFRYALDVFHPMFEKKFPVLLVPLLDKQSIMIGIHRIFFNHDGSQIKASQFPERTEKRMPLKLSLGKTVGGYATIYHSATQAKPALSSIIDTVFVSEGVENALVVKDALVNLGIDDRLMERRIYDALGMKDEYDIRACVGINGIIDVPIPDSAENVVILADNDAENIDTKRTMRETVEFFLKQGKRVLLSLPLSEGGKLDFNDVYARTPMERKFAAIADILRDSVAIEKLGLMGDDTEPLQKTFERIKGVAANSSLKAPSLEKPVSPVAPLQRRDRFLAPSVVAKDSEASVSAIDADASPGDKINSLYFDLMSSLRTFKPKR